MVAKYSLDTGHGWKAIEVGATATLTGDETLEGAQQELYSRLASQLKTLWANGRGTVLHRMPQKAPESTHSPPVRRAAPMAVGRASRTTTTSALSTNRSSRLG